VNGGFLLETVTLNSKMDYYK